ncbi:MAG: signal peptide peptidase SppA [Flavitalea sp.]
MNSFFKTFFAALLALVAFSVITTVISIIILVAVSSAVMSGNKNGVLSDNSVIVVDLNNNYKELSEPGLLSSLGQGVDNDVPSLYDLVRMIRHAKTDNSIKGIYLKCDGNDNGFASSEEIRSALIDFKSGGKFVFAYANVISQKAYYIANAANRLYCHPRGGVDWHGFAMQMPFIKGTLEKLEIEPQIFYAGKFKSATEPLREYQMTDANKLQSSELMFDLYSNLLIKTSSAREIDTATLHRYADSNRVEFASQALQNNMVDGLKYDDEVKDEIRGRLKIAKDATINFISVGKYASSVNFKKYGKGRIALIYAEGNIVDGSAERKNIGGDTYKNIIRKARLDKDIKAIVIRINSGGGSAMASEVIWREIILAKRVKPVVVSFGDVAASGGYYIACGADSIFAESTSITGSIGVFGILPNMQKFFNDKLGVTFDEVKTSPDANFMSVTKPLTPSQRLFFQNEIDTIYAGFKSRVAEGRKKSVEYIDSIAQGRVWSGSRALKLGLIDRIGSLDDAIASAASKAKLTDYRLSEYPEQKSFLESLLSKKSDDLKDAAIKEELGAEGYKTYMTIKNMQQFIGKAQARLPFEITIE